MIKDQDIDYDEFFNALNNSDKNMIGKEGSLLHYAVIYNPNLISSLLEYDIDTSIRNKNHETAFILECKTQLKSNHPDRIHINEFLEYFKQKFPKNDHYHIPDYDWHYLMEKKILLMNRA
jgi:hypothetical protein